MSWAAICGGQLKGSWKRNTTPLTQEAWLAVALSLPPPLNPFPCLFVLRSRTRSRETSNILELDCGRLKDDPGEPFLRAIINRPLKIVPRDMLRTLFRFFPFCFYLLASSSLSLFRCTTVSAYDPVCLSVVFQVRYPSFFRQG